MGAERRRAPRYQFIADAEVVEIESSMKLRAKTGDLSVGGCFLDMLTPSPEGTEIRVTIVRGSTEFTALGRVVFVFPNLGMGVVFTSVPVEGLATLEGWIKELSPSPDAGTFVESGGTNQDGES